MVQTVAEAETSRISKGCKTFPHSKKVQGSYKQILAPAFTFYTYRNVCTIIYVCVCEDLKCLKDFATYVSDNALEIIILIIFLASLLQRYI